MDKYTGKPQGKSRDAPDGAAGKAEPKAYAYAKASREGEHCVTEYASAGDPLYLMAAAMNLLIDAEKRTGLPQEELQLLRAQLREALQE